MSTDPKSQRELLQELTELRARLQEAEETLRAIRSGEVDALVMGEEVYTLKGAETPYRLLIESMNEGAATLASDGMILYCNRRFADMVATPAEQVIGSHLERWVVPAQQPIIQSLLTTAKSSGARAELALGAPPGPGLPVMLSLRPIQLDSHTIGVVAADLTDHKRAEEALRQARDTLEQRVAARTEELQQQREWLSVTLSSIGDALIATDAEGRISFLNPVAETLTGWPRKEALGQPVQTVFQILDETTRIPREDIVGRVLWEGATVKLANNTCLIARAGHEIPIEDSAAPIRDRDGKVAGAVLVFHDVAPKRRALRAMRESEERLRLLVDGTKDCAILMLDPQGRITTWNESARRIKGYKPQEIVGQHMSLFYTPEDVALGKPARDLEKAQREGKYEEEAERIRKDGSRFWASVLISPLRDDQGRLRGFSKVTRDITERKRAQDDLRQSESRYRMLMQSIPIPVGLVDRNGASIYYNDRFTQVFGYTQADIPTLQAWWQRAYPDPAYRLRVSENWQAKLQHSAQSRTETLPEEFTVTCKDDSVRVVVISNLVIDDCILACFIDITDRKKTEEALRRVSQRDAFLVSLADALRPLADVSEIKTTAARLLGQHLRASRVTYAEVTPEGDVIVERGYADGVPDIPGRYRLDDYGPSLLPEIRAGRNIVVADVANTPGYTEQEKARYVAVQVAANFNVPLLKNGRPVALLAVHQVVPRQWTDEEVLLVEETVERTWATVERARAEQALQTSYKELEAFNKAMVGRELRMIELKNEIDDLCAQFGQPPRYHPKIEP